MINIDIPEPTKKQGTKTPKKAVVKKISPPRIKGVFYDKSKKAWVSTICVDGKPKKLGRRVDQIEAIAMRLAAQQCLTTTVNSDAQKFMDNWVLENANVGGSVIDIFGDY